MKKSCRSNVVEYFTHEGAHFYIVGAFSYFSLGMFFVMLHIFMCDIMYIPQKNQSAAGIKRSKHDFATVLTMKL